MSYEEAAQALERLESVAPEDTEALRLAAALLRYCEEHREQMEEYVNGDLP